jgi:hypothetical protein
LQATTNTVVSVDAMELVFQLCEQPHPEVARHVLDTHFRKLGEELIAVGALVETAPSDVVVMPVDFDDEPVEFEWQPDLQAYAAFHPGRGWVVADHDARRRYRLDLEWLLRVLADEVGVASIARCSCLLDGLLWDLGDAWLHQKKRPVLFARRLSSMDNLDAVEHALVAREGRLGGALLTTSPGISRAVQLPGRHRILHVRDCVDHAARHFALDVDVIAGGRRWFAPGMEDPVQIGSDGGWIRIHERQYRFRGLIQRSIVQQVYEAWRDGAGRLRTQQVLETAESKSKELAQAFSGRPEFKEIIGYDDGFCWLKVD